MTPETVIDLFARGIGLTIMIISFIVFPGLVVGLIVAMFQAATQINEMSLSFLPKLIVTLLVLLFGGSWLMHTMISYTENLISSIPNLIG